MTKSEYLNHRIFFKNLHIYILEEEIKELKQELASLSEEDTQEIVDI